MGRQEQGNDPLKQSSDASADVDVTNPNPARMYDYYLGGAANFAVDREAAEQALAAHPHMRQAAQDNRSFLGRAVTALCQAGIDQFLDLGSGVPTVGNVHEIAHRLTPQARVAYVDNESVAVAHARRILEDVPHTSVSQADIRQPDQVLAAPGVAGLLDFARPVAVLAVAVVHFLADSDDPAGIIAAYRDACVPGSALALTHGSQVTLTDEQIAAFSNTYQRTNTGVVFRGPDEIQTFLRGYSLLEPGLVLMPEWRPDAPVEAETAAASNTYAAVATLSPRP